MVSKYHTKNLSLQAYKSNLQLEEKPFSSNISQGVQNLVHKTAQELGERSTRKAVLQQQDPGGDLFSGSSRFSILTQSQPSQGLPAHLLSLSISSLAYTENTVNNNFIINFIAKGYIFKIFPEVD